MKMTSWADVNIKLGQNNSYTSLILHLPTYRPVFGTPACPVYWLTQK